MMNVLLSKAKIVMQAEGTLLKAQAQRRTNSLLLTGIAIGLMLIALVFVNIGIFFYFAESVVEAKAAFGLAGLNLGLGAIPFILSKRQRPNQAEQMVQEIRDMMMNDIANDTQQATSDVKAVVSTVKTLKSGVSALGGGHSGMLAALPLLTMLIDVLKKRKS